MSEDIVNHPKHYEGSTSIECIEAMQVAFGKDFVIAFCLCNAFKYLWRHKNKGGKEDLQKAEWYVEKADVLNNKKKDVSNVSEKIETLRMLTKRYLLFEDVNEN